MGKTITACGAPLDSVRRVYKSTVQCSHTSHKRTFFIGKLRFIPGLLNSGVAWIPDDGYPAEEIARESDSERVREQKSND